MNKKGFTLIELLSVIVILGVITTIAVPSVNNIIDKSKKKTFVTIAQNYVRAVDYALMSEEFEKPVNSNDLLIINLSAIEMENNSDRSPFGEKWVDNKSYVAVRNVGSILTPIYEYYFAAQDENKNAIPLTKIDDITTDTITNKARNTMEVTVQSLAGNISGYKAQKGIVSGIENIVIDGVTQDWNVIIYSNK